MQIRKSGRGETPASLQGATKKPRAAEKREGARNLNGGPWKMEKERAPNKLSSGGGKLVGESVENVLTVDVRRS